MKGQPPRRKKMKVSIYPASIFSKSLGLGFFCPMGDSVLQTCRIPVVSQGVEHKSLQSRLKPFAPHCASFPFTRLDTTKLGYFLLDAHTRAQGKPRLLSRLP